MRLLRSKLAIGKMIGLLLALIIVVLAIAGAVAFTLMQHSSTLPLYSTPTLSPSSSSEETFTPYPTNTPSPTPAHSPASEETFTPYPTNTPSPTLPPTPTPTPIPTFDLATAVAIGLVQATITGSNLQNVYIDLNSNSDNSMNITIPLGTVFNAQSASVQNMVTLNAQNLILAPHGTVSRTLSTACINMHLDTPNGQNSFTIRSVPTSEDLIKLLSLTYFGSETSRVKQFAIWTITDNPTRYGYVQLGSSGSYSGPTDAEMQRIQTLFINAGIATQNYKALNTSPTPTPTQNTPTPTPTQNTPTPTPTQNTPTPTPTQNPNKSTPTFTLTSNASAVKIGSGISINLTGTLSLPKTATVLIQWAIDSSSFEGSNLQFLTNGVFTENYGYPNNLPQPRFDQVGTWQVRAYFSGDSTTNPVTSNIITVFVTQ
jgi:hypothetical protein